MKAYKDYMDTISVSRDLHRRLISCAANSKTVRRSISRRRYLPIFACISILLLWVLTDTHLGQAPVPTPEQGLSIPPDSSSGGITAPPYPLIFNKAQQPLLADAAISSYFSQALTEAEIQRVFPHLADTYTLEATQTIQIKKGRSALSSIQMNLSSVDGSSAYIQIEPGDADPGYSMDGDVITSDVLGTVVTAGYFDAEPGHEEEPVTYFAAFKLSDLLYYVQLGGSQRQAAWSQNQISALVASLIQEGAANLNDLDIPSLPEEQSNQIDMLAARADPDFGQYLPHTLPDAFQFESAVRFISQERNGLGILWTDGMREIHWNISDLTDADKARITAAQDARNYDLGLYPIPRADSVPGELREIVTNPIFRMGDLTPALVQARSESVSDTNDLSGSRMRFGVLYGDILVEITVKGASPDAVISMLRQVQDQIG